jgi:ATP synthase protein I
VFRAIFLQATATIVTMVVAGLLAGWAGAVSAGLGGGAIVLPNFLFALRIKVSMLGNLSRGGKASPLASSIGFLVGEAVKLVATLGLLALIAKSYPGLHWLSMLSGLIVALKSVLFYPWLSERLGWNKSKNLF